MGQLQLHLRERPRAKWLTCIDSILGTKQGVDIFFVVIRSDDISSGRAEIIRWVAESLWPFSIVEDCGFKMLMKTGWPEYYIPSVATVSRDVCQVFVHTRIQVARMLQVSEVTNQQSGNWFTYQKYEGKLNFTTDAWTSPNHRAFVTFCVYLEHKRKSLLIPLDVVKVAKVRPTRLNNVPLLKWL